MNKLTTYYLCININIHNFSFVQLDRGPHSEIRRAIIRPHADHGTLTTV